MATVFVMPCLNEERLLQATALSLGFGECDNPAGQDVFLILVDNGSADGTLAVMERIASASPPGSVRIVIESERGFVPPRRRGVLAAVELAKELGVASTQLLILQADADTDYLPGYAQAMWQAVEGRQGILLEGAMRRPPEFDAAHPEYTALERLVDASHEELGVTDEEEVIVGDSMCGYLLSDYIGWGGHFRERHPRGGTVHAETTRLFLRARLACGASKIRVNPAKAVTSRRRVVEEPALHFATSGFPREDAWVMSWRERHVTPWTVDGFARNVDHPDVQEACFYRGAHDIALFALLPWVVARAADPEGFAPRDERARRFLELVPSLSAKALIEHPARALIAVLDAIDNRPDAFR